MRVRQANGYSPRGAAVVVSMDGANTIDTADFERAVGALVDTPVVVLPPDAAGLAGLLPGTERLVVAHAGPGRFLYDRVEGAGFGINTSVDLENYDFVQGMLTLVWTLAAVIIAIGLLTFTIAGIDRALSRRRELTALRLIGTPGRLLRTAQWWEAALPTVFGSLLAIAAGGYAGATYLQLDNDTGHAPHDSLRARRCRHGHVHAPGLDHDTRNNGPPRSGAHPGRVAFVSRGRPGARRPRARPGPPTR